MPALAGAFRFESKVQITSIDLMQSRLQRGGAQYTRLLASPLGGEQSVTGD